MTYQTKLKAIFLYKILCVLNETLKVKKLYKYVCMIYIIFSRNIYSNELNKLASRFFFF